MNTYDVWCVLAPLTRTRVVAPDSFTARRDFAALHAGMEVTDVCARRIWQHYED